MFDTAKRGILLVLCVLLRKRGVFYCLPKSYHYANIFTTLTLKSSNLLFIKTESLGCCHGNCYFYWNILNGTHALVLILLCLCHRQFPIQYSQMCKNSRFCMWMWAARRKEHLDRLQKLAGGLPCISPTDQHLVSAKLIIFPDSLSMASSGHQIRRTLPSD